MRKLKNKIFFFLCLGIIPFEGCSHAPSMIPTVVNAFNLESFNLSQKDIMQSNLNYYYTQSDLYVSDNVNKKIMAFNGANHLFLELGKIKNTINDDSKNIWQGELDLLIKNLSSKQKITNNVQNRQKEEVSKTKTSIIKREYAFDEIGQIAVDFSGNIYVENIISKKNKVENNKINLKTKVKKLPLKTPLQNPVQPSTIQASPTPGTITLVNPNIPIVGAGDVPPAMNQEVEILKFSKEGRFLYRIGEEGRDNPNFQGNIDILGILFNKDNGMWVKYIKDGHMYIRSYTNYGKNLIFFEEPKIQAVVDATLKQGNPNLHYIIEDICPIINSQQLNVIVDIYDTKSRTIRIKERRVFVMNKDYSIPNIWKLKPLNSQIYTVTNTGLLYSLSYDSSADKSIVEMFSETGASKLKRSISFQYKYYKRYSIISTQDGKFLGVFLRDMDVVFVLWR